MPLQFSDLLPGPGQEENCHLRIMRRGFAGVSRSVCSANSKKKAGHHGYTARAPRAISVPFLTIADHRW